MLHGNPTWSYYFRHLVQACRLNGFHALVPDHIGCGLSEKPLGSNYSYTLQQRVYDFDEFIQKQCVASEFHLIVHDWGGMIGMAYAAKHPEKILSLTILNTAAFPLPKKKRFPWQLALARTRFPGEFLIRYFNLFVLGASRFCVTKHRMTAEEKAYYSKPYNSFQNRIAVAKFVQDIPRSEKDTSYPILIDTAANLKKLQEKPIFIGWGMKDFIFDHHFLAEWKKRFPNAEIFRYPDAGHYILEDERREIIPEIVKFLKK